MDLSKLPKLSQTPPPPSEPSPEDRRAAAVAAETQTDGRNAFCPACGEKVPVGQRFCGKCGSDTWARPAEASAHGEPLGGALRFGFAEVWFFGIVGALLLIWGGAFARFEWARLSNQSFYPGFVWAADDDKGHKANQPVEYRDLEPQSLAEFNHTMWTNASIFALGMALIIIALARAACFVRSRRVQSAALTIAVLTTLAVTLYNIYLSTKLYRDGITPLISLMLVAVSGFLVFDQLAMLQFSRREASRPH